MENGKYFVVAPMKLQITFFLFVLFPLLNVPAQETNPEPEKDSKEKREEKKKRKEKPEVRTVPVLYYSILSKSTGHCVAISMAEKKNGAVAIEWTSQLGPEQLWRLQPVEGAWFQLVARHSDRALTIRDTDRNAVVQGNTFGDNSSHWKLDSDEDGFVRLVNRVDNRCLALARTKGAHGQGLVLSQEADTDRQKWQLQVAEVEYRKELISKKLAIPASELIDKKHPVTTDEVMAFLHETTWSIRYGSPSATEEYRMTFDKKGTLTLNSGRVSSLRVLGPKTIKLWNYDHGSLSDQYNYFRAVDCNDKVYYGVLLPSEE